MLVFGDNMRGKTSLLNAFRWGFYGRPRATFANDCRHEILNKEAAPEAEWTFEVQIGFEANGHSFDFRRRAKTADGIGAATRRPVSGSNPPLRGRHACPG